MTEQQNEQQWPASTDVGRYGDMSQFAHLRVGLDGDNDVYVSVYDDKGGASIEFCVPGIGGGASPRTREALIGVMVAMEQDNAADPLRDWWKARSVAPAPVEQPATTEESSAVERQGEWERCQSIAECPDVDAVLQAFADDPTSDQGVMIVREVLRAECFNGEIGTMEGVTISSAPVERVELMTWPQAVDRAARLIDEEQERMTAEGYLMDSDDCCDVLRESVDDPQPVPAADTNPEHTLFNEIRLSADVSEDDESAQYLISEDQLQRIRLLESRSGAAAQDVAALVEAARKADDILASLTASNKPADRLERDLGKDWMASIYKVRREITTAIAVHQSEGVES